MYQEMYSKYIIISTMEQQIMHKQSILDNNESQVKTPRNAVQNSVMMSCAAQGNSYRSRTLLSNSHLQNNKEKQGQNKGQFVISYNFDHNSNVGCVTRNIFIGWDDDQPVKKIKPIKKINSNIRNNVASTNKYKILNKIIDQGQQKENTNELTKRISNNTYTNFRNNKIQQFNNSSTKNKKSNYTNFRSKECSLYKDSFVDCNETTIKLKNNQNDKNMNQKTRMPAITAINTVNYINSAKSRNKTLEKQKEKGRDDYQLQEISNRNTICNNNNNNVKQRNSSLSKLKPIQNPIQKTARVTQSQPQQKQNNKYKNKNNQHEIDNKQECNKKKQDETFNSKVKIPSVYANMKRNHPSQQQKVSNNIQNKKDSEQSKVRNNQEYRKGKTIQHKPVSKSIHKNNEIQKVNNKIVQQNIIKNNKQIKTKPDEQQQLKLTSPHKQKQKNQTNKSKDKAYKTSKIFNTMSPFHTQKDQQKKSQKQPQKLIQLVQKDDKKQAKVDTSNRNNIKNCNMNNSLNQYQNVQEKQKQQQKHQINDDICDFGADTLKLIQQLQRMESEHQNKMQEHINKENDNLENMQDKEKSRLKEKTQAKQKIGNIENIKHQEQKENQDNKQQQANKEEKYKKNNIKILPQSIKQKSKQTININKEQNKNNSINKNSDKINNNQTKKKGKKQKQAQQQKQGNIKNNANTQQKQKNQTNFRKESHNTLHQKIVDKSTKSLKAQEYEHSNSKRKDSILHTNNLIQTKQKDQKVQQQIKQTPQLQKIVPCQKQKIQTQSKQQMKNKSNCKEQQRNVNQSKVSKDESFLVQNSNNSQNICKKQQKGAVQKYNSTDVSVPKNTTKLKIQNKNQNQKLKQNTQSKISLRSNSSFKQKCKQRNQSLSQKMDNSQIQQKTKSRFSIASKMQSKGKISQNSNRSKQKKIDNTIIIDQQKSVRNNQVQNKSKNQQIKHAEQSIQKITNHEATSLQNNKQSIIKSCMQTGNQTDRRQQIRKPNSGAAIYRTKFDKDQTKRQSAKTQQRESISENQQKIQSKFDNQQIHEQINSSIKSNHIVDDKYNNQFKKALDSINISNQKSQSMKVSQQSKRSNSSLDKFIEAEEKKRKNSQIKSNKMQKSQKQSKKSTLISQKQSINKSLKTQQNHQETNKNTAQQLKNKGNQPKIMISQGSNSINRKKNDIKQEEIANSDSDLQVNPQPTQQSILKQEANVANKNKMSQLNNLPQNSIKSMSQPSLSSRSSQPKPIKIKEYRHVSVQMSQEDIPEGKKYESSNQKLNDLKNKPNHGINVSVGTSVKQVKQTGILNQMDTELIKYQEQQQQQPKITKKQSIRNSKIEKNQNTFEQKNVNQPHKNIQHQKQVQQKNQNQQHNDIVSFANISCSPQIQPVRKQSFLDVTNNDNLNKTDIPPIVPIKQRKLNSSIQPSKHASIIQYIYGQDAKYVQSQLPKIYSFTQKSPLLNNSTFFCSSSNNQQQQRYSLQQYSYCPISRALQLISSIKTNNIMTQSLFTRIIEPYLSNEDQHQLWLYIKGKWTLCKTSSQFSKVVQITYQQVITDVINNAVHKYYGRQYVNENGVNNLGIQQIVRMITGFRVMQLKNKKKLTQQLQYHLKKGNTIKGISLDPSKPYYSITSIETTAKNEKLIQIQLPQLAQSCRQNNNNDDNAMKNDNNIIWIKQQTFQKYFDYFLLICVQEQQYWTSKTMKINQFLQNNNQNIRKSKEVRDQTLVYTLDSIQNAVGALQVHVQSACLCKVDLYRQIKPRVLKFVGSVNQKNKPNISIQNPNPTLYFNFNLKGRYYLLIKFNQLQAQKCPYISLCSSAKIQISYLQSIQAQTYKNSTSQYIQIGNINRSIRNNNSSHHSDNTNNIQGSNSRVVGNNKSNNNIKDKQNNLKNNNDKIVEIDKKEHIKKMFVDYLMNSQDVQKQNQNNSHHTNRQL